MVLIRTLLLMFILAGSIPAADAWLGFSFRAVDDGVEVIGVHPSSGAAAAGLQPRDVVLKVAGRSALPVSQLKTVVGGLKAGSSLELEYRRNGQTHKASVTLKARPADISAFMGSPIGSKAMPLGDAWYANADKVLKTPKVTILDFWATWCGPCRMTIPKLSRLHQKLASKGVMIIGVSNEDLDVLQRAQIKDKTPYPLYREDGSLSARYGIRAIPTLLVLDANGYIRSIAQGVPSEAALETQILEILREGSKP